MLIDEKLIKDIIIQISLGLKEIHKNKLIHRDLTPDNIFFDKNNNIKIDDFGVSKIITNSMDGLTVLPQLISWWTPVELTLEEIFD